MTEYPHWHCPQSLLPPSGQHRLHWQHPWFADNGVDYDSETVIQRDIYLDGRNVCRVNGCLVTVSILRKLGLQLINIHGQHDSASLFDEANHLKLLDDFAYISDHNFARILYEGDVSNHYNEDGWIGQSHVTLYDMNFQPFELTCEEATVDRRQA